MLRRAGFAAVGFISGAMLSMITVMPLCVLLVRVINGPQHWVLAVVVVPLGVAGAAAVWGFVAQERMVETLNTWWAVIMDRCSRR